MKKMIFFTAIFMLFFNLSNAATLYWFCASAVKKPSEKIASMFNKTHKDKVSLITGGTGQILEQMILSNKGDVYACMDSKFFKMAKSKKITSGYIKFLKLTPVFGVSSQAKEKIKGFNDIFKKGVKIAAGNPRTMALGKTYLYILKKLPKKMENNLKKNVEVEAINISQIVNYIKMNSADAGILFKAVAKVNKIKYIRIPEQYNRIKTGYLIKMKFTSNKKLQNELFNFIIKHLDVYEQYGFEVIYQ